jgi:hypothetical protein
LCVAIAIYWQAMKDQLKWRIGPLALLLRS